MKNFALLVILIVNCGLFFVASILTVPGDGSEAYMEIKWAIGLGWIVIVLLGSLKLISMGRSEMAFLLAVLTLPLALVGFMLAFSALDLYASLKPNSKEFKAACRSVGVTYFHKPNSPVHSIAYDWPADAYPPRFSSFKLDGRGNVSAEASGLPRFPEQIEFTEVRGGRYEGPPSNGIGPFIRHPRSGPYNGIAELSADALVTFNQVEKPAIGSKFNVQLWQVTVQDRRDGQVLAELRYATDWKNKRACGETSPGVMDERAFVLRAVGIP